MIPIDFSGKVALVTGVGDNESFAWYISKALQAAGAKIVLASHPRVVGIVESFLTRDMDAESRKLPYGGGELKAEKVYPLDARFDSMADVDEATRNDKRWNKYPFYAIKEVVDAVGKEFGGIDILIHSIAFSREIKNRHDRHQPVGLLTRRSGISAVLADEPAAGRRAVHGEPAGRGERRRADVPGRVAGRAVLRRRDVHGQGGPADRRRPARPQPGDEEHPGEPDLGGTVRLAGGPRDRGHPAVDRLRGQAVAAAAGDRAGGSGQRDRLPVQPAGQRDHRATRCSWTAATT